MRTRKAIGLIIMNNKNEILLVHKVKIMDGENKVRIGEWDFPKGGIKIGETIEDAIRREIFEETSINEYEIVKRLPDFEFNFTQEIREIINFDNQITYVYQILHTGNIHDIKPDYEEIDEINFYSIEEVIEILHHNNAKIYLKSLITNKYININ